MERLSPVALLLFAVTVTFASFDWLMSLDAAVVQHDLRRLFLFGRRGRRFLPRSSWRPWPCNCPAD